MRTPSASGHRPPPKDAGPLRLLTMITRLELGGAQQVALNTLARLDPARYAKHLLAGKGGYLDSRALGLPDVHVRLWRALKHPLHPGWDPVVWLRLAALLRRERIQILHTHSSKAGMLGRLAGAWAGVPVILHTIHGWPFHDRQPAWLRRTYIELERRAALVSTRLIAVSERTREIGLAAGIGRPEQYRVVYPGSDLTPFRPADPAARRGVRREFGFPDEALLVGMVGCLKPQKAPEDFIAAAAIIGARVPEARFLLVGDGRLRRRVAAAAAGRDLQGRLVLAGWREDMPRLMGALDLMVHSARWEGLPCVFAQAQACGVPVVATDVGGTREAIVPDQSGLLVPPGQPAVLGRTAASLLRDAPRRAAYGRQGLRHARAFSLETMVERLDALYGELAGSASVPGVGK